MKMPLGKSGWGIQLSKWFTLVGVGCHQKLVKWQWSWDKKMNTEIKGLQNLSCPIFFQKILGKVLKNNFQTKIFIKGISKIRKVGGIKNILQYKINSIIIKANRKEIKLNECRG